MLIKYSRHSIFWNRLFWNTAYFETLRKCRHFSHRDNVKNTVYFEPLYFEILSILNEFSTSLYNIVYLFILKYLSNSVLIWEHKSNSYTLIIKVLLNTISFVYFLSAINKILKLMNKICTLNELFILSSFQHTGYFENSLFWTKLFGRSGFKITRFYCIQFK